MPGSRSGPLVFLEFDRVEASSPDLLDLYFTMTVENTWNSPTAFSLESYRVLVDGYELQGTPVTGTSLLFSESPDSNVQLDPLSRETIPVRLQVNLKQVKYIEEGRRIPPGQSPDLVVELAVHIGFTFNNKKKSSASATALAEFIRIREPVFTIDSIVIMQAELINTRLKVCITINNPNPFPVELAAFSYELYGGGRFWADGTERNVLSVPSSGHAEKELFLVMNFIDMRRDLLDRVIAMDRVLYRFAGAVQVTTEVNYLPLYTQQFNLEGESPVIR